MGHLESRITCTISTSTYYNNPLRDESHILWNYLDIPAPDPQGFVEAINVDAYTGQDDIKFGIVAAWSSFQKWDMLNRSSDLMTLLLRPYPPTM